MAYFGKICHPWPLRATVKPGRGLLDSRDHGTLKLRGVLLLRGYFRLDRRPFMASPNRSPICFRRGRKAVGVIVPIELWQEIESERETSYLLKSDAMKRRLRSQEPPRRRLT